ncbi:MAG: lipocalin family protein [Calditrichaceae bacterium]|nr:lipocalin family protein [Calditrichaceae bacterium]
MDNWSKYVLLVIFIFLIVKINKGQDTEQTMVELVTVNYVDLNRYAGVWHEIARIPNRFQKQCARNVTAAYSLNDDGAIKVINRCLQEDGIEDKAIGKARVIDTTSNAKLEVSFVSIFGFHLFWGDYWIIGLDEDYQYAIIGAPSRKYGWILSRQKTMSEELYTEAEQILLSQGYNPDDFELTIQK